MCPHRETLPAQTRSLNLPALQRSFSKVVFLSLLDLNRSIRHYRPKELFMNGSCGEERCSIHVPFYRSFFGFAAGLIRVVTALLPPEVN